LIDVRGDAGDAELRQDRRDGQLRLRFSGHWTTETIAQKAALLARLDPGDERRALLDLSSLDVMDTAAAWLIHKTGKRLQAEGLEVVLEGVSPARQRLLAKVAMTEQPAADPRRAQPFAAIVERCGRATIEIFQQSRELLSFLGLTTILLWRSLRRPGRIRLTSLAFHLERTGIDSLPIVGLLSFLIGVVLAYMGIDQLARFGAQSLTVNLVGVGVLREMGVLITAIIVAGRSGSAFTAQIGTMKVNEEVDAMRAIGLHPVEVLVVPRVLALVIVMPLLAFYANIMGLLGGAVMSWLALDINLIQFARLLNDAVSLNSLAAGLIKAPVFAFVIALVGCFEGLKVTSSAESVGFQTTRSVVEAISMVIVIDAIFNIFYSIVGL
jgi:phospholipid/cholesterol/gamma-HCH transport system permease protein|tara:strand:- start:2236 stop:3381 length:1146 start_codon:yes stop_codon:yes gene_type:complete